MPPAHRQINSILLYRENEIIAECYYNGFHENSKNVIKSIAKSIMSIAAGIALDNGLLKSLDEPIYKFIPQFGEGRDMLHKAVTVCSGGAEKAGMAAGAMEGRVLRFCRSRTL